MTLEERIERLERTNRRYRLMFTLLGAIVVCAVGISAALDAGVPDVIRAKAFEVVDDGGKVLVNLKQSDGAGSLGIFDKTGDILVGIMGFTVNGEVSGYVFTYHDGEPLVALSSTFCGDGLVRTFNNKGKPVVQLTVSMNGEGGVLRTLNGKGETLLELGVTVEGQGLVRTFNGKGTVLVELGVATGGVEKYGKIITFNDKGKELVDIGSRVGNGSVTVYNRTGDEVCTLMVDEYGNGVIGAWNRNGKGRTLTPGP